MSPRARRILIPLIVALAVCGVLLAVINAPNKPSRSSAAQPSSPLPPATSAASTTAPATHSSSQSSTAPSTATSTATSTAPAIATSQAGLRAMAPGNDIGPDQPPLPLGSLDPRRDRMRLEFTRLGGGIAAIPFADFWETAHAKRAADRYLQSLPPDQPIDFSKLQEDQRYVLQTQQPFTWSGGSVQVPVMAAHSVVVNGTTIGLLLESVWTQIAPGEFQTRIVDANGAAMLEITRRFTFTPGAPYDITLQQRVRNLSNNPVDVKWQQYGPVELRHDPSGYIDRRRFAFGYLPKPKTDANLVLSNDGDLDVERSSALSRYQKSISAGNPQTALQLLSLWPNRTSIAQGYGLSWFASTNRYFGLAVHPQFANGATQTSLESSVQEVRIDASPSPVNVNDQVVFTFLVSPVQTVAPGGESSFDLGVYAGPLDRHILNNDPYSKLAMDGVILYRMTGGCCTFLTFQWLAHGLLWFLSLLHAILFDWGLAIIGLVIVVRTLLHPLTKKSQVSIQRFSKQMAVMKPEIDKLQKKFPNDTKRVQQEQMKLMREHGVNPFQMLGCLPMFLQMPIWIALWAMLYLAFDIREQPAFYGVFQLIGGWNFLGDLSSQDQFIDLGNGFMIPLLGWKVTSVNLLPMLMGFVFYFQQKYMSPPPSASMTPEQAQQQKIMKVMMVLMMPLVMYKSPSGLTLYILTSSCIGILESRYIRKHIDEMDTTSLKPGEPKPPKKPRDPRFRAWADAIERARAKRASADPQRTFKKRK